MFLFSSLHPSPQLPKPEQQGMHQAKKPLLNPPYQGGTKNCGFKGAALVMMSAVFTKKALFYIQYWGLLEGVLRLNRVHEFLCSYIFPLGQCK